ncbi:MAG: succinate dehydrogenase cytochrome b subunit [Bdellovibrionales bacterium]|nr:succinate dehydrogenase cytochrome b subunit [Oligoflexia bacterium]
MVPLKRLFSSSLGKKYIMGSSGLAIGLFLIVHLLGNLTLFSPNGDMINTYSAQLHSLGYILKVVEWVLFGIFAIHILMAFWIAIGNKRARSIAYSESHSKNGNSKNTILSRNMIISGTVLGVFLGIHLYQFWAGPGIEQGYTATVNGIMVHDIYRVVTERFSSIGWVSFYVGCMFFLGFHLRHAYWSGFQSLGLMNPRWSKPIHLASLMLAILLSIGFLILPIYIYTTQGGGGNS